MTIGPRFGGFFRFGMDVAIWWMKGIKKMNIDANELNSRLWAEWRNGMKIMSESSSKRHGRKLGNERNPET